ncbi:MAG: hypothetical protein ACYTBS_08990 [Planctomycetota bacterium]|jgi:hypothetical protein
MHEEEGLTPAEQELELALGRLKPAANTLNRDALMYNAGLAAARGKRPWQMFSGVLTLLLLCSILIRPELRRTEGFSSPGDIGEFQVAQAVYAPVQAEPFGSLVYPKLRQSIVKYGLDALPLRQGVGRDAQQKSRRQLLESMLSS